MLPKLNKKRASFVLTKIDEILAWEKRKETERDTRFVELGSYMCEVWARQYWRLENLKSFDEFLERRFPILHVLNVPVSNPGPGFPQGSSAGAPVVPSSGAMTSLTISNTTSDTRSSPWVDYTIDTMYVGNAAAQMTTIAQLSAIATTSAARCGPITEFYNANIAGGTDFFFFGVTRNCSVGTGVANGCVVSTDDRRCHRHDCCPSAGRHERHNRQQQSSTQRLQHLFLD